MVMLRQEVAGEAIVSRALSRFADVTNDFRPAWEQIADDFLDVERRLFETEGAESGSAWQPLSPAYASWKARNYPGLPILQRTRAMQESLTQRGGDHIEIIQPDQLVLGTRDRKAVLHQVGAGRLPVRKAIALNDRNRTRWVKLLQRYLVDKATELGLRP